MSQPTLQGMEAVNALLDATPEAPSYMIGIQESKVTRVPLMEAVKMVRTLLAPETSPNFTQWLDSLGRNRHQREGFLEGNVAPRPRIQGGPRWLLRHLCRI